MKLRREISRGRVYTTVACLIPVLAAFICLQPACRAQQPSASPSAVRSDVAADPLKCVNWTSGPQNVTFENVADIYVPDGFRLTDVHGARMILVSFNNPVPDDLIGIMVPASGKWMAILEYSPAGYVADPGVSQIDTNAVLQQVLDQMGKKAKSSVATLSWQSPPAYDSTQHTLEWSLLAASSSSAKVLSRTAALLGRHGIFQITIVQPASLPGMPSLQELAGDIAFKNGERYTDYQSGDKIAELGLADLILGDKHAQAGLASTGFESVAAWIYGGLAVCLVTVGVVMFLRKNKTPQQGRHRRRHARALVPVTEVENKAPASSVPPNQMSLALKINESNGHARPKPVSRQGNWSKPFRRKHRKRVFDYSKFYMKLTRELSRGSYTSTNATNGKTVSNGHGNNGSNGHANGHAAPNGATVNQTMKPEITSLIASQQSLIKEQISLLEQQAKLLEEKSRLIEEQRAFLGSQAILDISPPRFTKSG